LITCRASGDTRVRTAVVAYDSCLNLVFNFLLFICTRDLRLIDVEAVMSYTGFSCQTHTVIISCKLNEHLQYASSCLCAMLTVVRVCPMCNCSGASDRKRRQRKATR